MEHRPSFQFPQAPNMVCKIQKALYGLKHAPRALFKKLHGALLYFGFTSAKSDQPLFIKITPQCTIYLLVHVDNMFITGNDSHTITNLI